MYTRCPTCGTIYEIGEDVLQASLGVVRCGHCGQRFDALASLSNELPQGPDDASPADAPETAPPTLTRSIPTAALAATDEPAQGLDTVPPARTKTGPEPARDDSTQASATLPSRVGADPQGVVPLMLVERDRGDETAEAPTDLERSEADWLSEAAVPPNNDPDRLPVAPESGDSAEADAVDGDSPDASHPDPADSTVTEPTPAPVGADPPVYVAPPRRRRWRRSDWLLAAGCLALLVALAAQLAWAKRVALVLDPATQADALRVCAAIDCRLPPIRDVARLELLARDVRPDPERQGALMITATLRNNAPFRQPWPVVVARLTDLDNRTVAMRRFRPAAYLPDVARRRAGLAPDTTAAIALEVADPGRRAVSFHFSFE